MKKIIAIVLVLLLCLAAACAPAAKEDMPEVTPEPAPAAEEAQPEEKAEPEAAEEVAAEPEETPEEEPAAEPAKEWPVVYESVLRSDSTDDMPDDGATKYQERLELLDDTNGKLSYITYYDEKQYDSITIVGTYEKTGENVIVLTYTGSDSDTVYTATVDEGLILALENEYISRSGEKIAGTYTNADLTLTIETDGSAVLSRTFGENYSGSIWERDDGSYELYCYDEKTDTAKDWLIRLNGENFSLETFSHAMYSKYAGEYMLYGDLGNITLDVDDEGIASCMVTVLMNTVPAKGYIWTDYEQEIMTGCYLETENGQRLNLSFGEMSDGVINYFGTLEIPLGAG